MKTGKCSIFHKNQIIAFGRYKAVSRISNVIQGICMCELSRLFHANEFLNQLKVYLTFHCIS